MNLSEVLRVCREQTMATLDTLDSLIQWSDRLNQVLITMNSGHPALPPPNLNGAAASPGPGVARATRAAAEAVGGSTRERILAATTGWTGAVEIIEAVGTETNAHAVHSMLRNLVREGVLRRRGKRKSYQYQRTGANPMADGRRRHGVTRAKLASQAKEWISSVELRRRVRALGVTDGAFNAALRNMTIDKELAVRGKSRAREYMVKG